MSSSIWGNPFGNIENEWEAYNKKINPTTGSTGSVAGQNTRPPSSGGIQSGGGAVGDSASGVASGVGNQVPANPFQTPAPLSSGSGYDTNPFAGGRTDIDPNAYYYGWGDNVNALANNPEMANMAWRIKQGYGEGLDRLLNRFDPASVYQALGGGVLTGAGKADMIGAFNDTMINQKGSYFDPRSIISGIASIAGRWSAGNPETGNGASDVGIEQYVDNPTLAPEEQVQNVGQFILASLQGILPVESYQAYQNLLQREGQKFIYYRTKNPESIGNASFLDWMVRVYGPGLGLF